MPTPTCPRCHLEIQPDWDWCHGCGFDPEHLKPEGWSPAGAMAIAPVIPPPAATGPVRTTGGGPGLTHARLTPAPPAGSPGPPTGPGAARGAGGPLPYAPGAYPPPTSSSSGVLRTLLIIGGVVLLVPILLIAAVTLFGTSASSRFEPIEPIATPTDDSAAPTPSLPAEWRTYEPSDGSFTIDFPCSPISGEETIDGVKQAGAKCEVPGDADAAYLATYFEFGSDRATGDPTALLNRMVRSIGDGESMTVISNDPTEFAGLPSRRVIAQGTGRNTNGVISNNTLDARLLVVGRRTYLIATSVGQGGHAETDRFVSSFQLHA